MSLLDLWFFFVFIPGLAESIKVAGSVVGACFVLGVIFTIISTCDDHELAPKVRKYTIMSLAAVLFLVFVANILPNQRTVYMLAGAYAVTNIEGIEKMPKNVVEAANRYLESINENAQVE